MTLLVLYIALVGLHSLMIPAKACLELTENARPVLFCQTSISRLPLNSDSIPAQIAKVRILGTSAKGQHDGRLGQANLTGLETLTYLEISNFNLEVILADTFRAMQQLRVLDLSRNRITTIQAGAFSGLKVDLLSLTDNAGLSLSRGVFRGAEVRNLAVRNCGLREVDYSTIAEAKPRQLGLSQNQLTTLDLRFEKIIKPWASASQTALADVDEWGFIDLTNNPLNCDCQLVWLPKVLEEQLYTAHRYEPKIGYDASKDQTRLPVGLEASNEIPVKRMYQLNLTCASPPKLANKPMPQSWNFYCPKPKVVGIVVSLLTSQADHAQLTCIGQGQPPPRLAWTYRLNGHKVQKTLDSPSANHFVAGDKSHLGAEFDDYRPIPSGHGSAKVMYTRSIALNVSLHDTTAKNFTCTVWNDDSLKEASENHPFDLIDRLKLGGLDREHMEAIQNGRIHEVTVRVLGPPRLLPDSVVQPSINLLPHEMNEVIRANGTYSGTHMTATEAATLNAVATGQYDYLFTERFSLLQLLGAVFGTFIVTLALLYMVTHFLSCFCHFPAFPVHKLASKATNDKEPKRRRFPLLQPREKALFSSKHCTPERTPLSDNSLGNTFNCDSAFSLLTSGTNNFNLTQGPATVSVRKQTIPQALLLTSVPTPPGDRVSATPPPNPAYWSMPEYTYTGSHEYDVPRPLEPLMTSQSLARTNQADTQIPTTGTVPTFLTLNKSAGLSMFHATQLLDSGYKHSPFGFPYGGTIPPVLGQWPQQTTQEMSALNTLFSLGHMENHPSNGMAPMLERQLPCINYTQYPPSNSAVYGADYPAYLQTRPYPHHQSKTQPLLQLTAHSNHLLGTMNGGMENSDRYLQSSDPNTDQPNLTCSASDDRSP